MSALLLAKCCCGGLCTSCNDCTSDYSPLHNQIDDPGCFPRSVKVTLADIFPNEGPIPESSGYKSTINGNDFFFTGLSGALNGEYTLHQTTAGYVYDVSPSELLPTFDRPDALIGRCRLIIGLGINGGFGVKLVGIVLIYGVEDPTEDDTPVDAVEFDFNILSTQFTLQEDYVRCLDLDETENGTGEGVETFDPDEVVADGDEPTPIPYFAKWDDGGYDKANYLDEQGTAIVAICAGDDSTPQDPFNPDELNTSYAVTATGSIQVLGIDGVSILQTCPVGGPAYLNFEETTMPAYSSTRTFEQLDDPLIEYTGQTVGTSPFCTYLNQLVINLIDGEWQLRIGPPPGVILYKSNSYAPIGKWGGAFESYEDPESGETILVDVTGVYVG